jgi:hypothetical protein
MKIILFLGLLVSTFIFSSSWFTFEKQIDYATEVKPILNKNCIFCHGGVKKQGGFSMLFEEEAFANTKSGRPAIIRGDAANSDFIKRLTHPDPNERMPQKGSLSKEEIEKLTKWVDQGAKWGEHWAYNKVEKPSVPSVGTFLGRLGLVKNEENEWVKNEIDHFVLDKLKKENLKPVAEAPKTVLLRRLYLDLVGMPPNEKELATFLANKDPNAYEKEVDKLLNRNQFGEKWAGMWLDLARYADTKGYERDASRTIWRYRDYVINAFNNDKPFDQFTIEQLAGDLLPNPTDEQLIATAFHRNTMNNDEGGTVDEEFRVAAVLDRVATTFDVWQGTTIACVQCHSHPYDPIKHDEFYKLMAFFNNSRDEDLTTEAPNLRIFKKEDSVKIELVKKYFNTFEDKGAYYQHFIRTMEPKMHGHDFVRYENTALIDEKFFGFKDNGSCKIEGFTFDGKPKRLFINHGADKDVADAVITLRLDKKDGKIIKSYTVPSKGSAWSHTVEAIDLPILKGKHDFYLSMSHPKVKDKWVQIDWISIQNPIKDDSVHKKYLELANTNTENHPILQEGFGDLKRKTHVFERGNWLVHGKEVEPDVPEILGKMNTNLPKNRLGFAKWLVDEKNPLTARVTVNRIWEQIFGIGLIETVEDFGSQGFAASHPELLDYMAFSFQKDMKWSMKTLIKKIVSSATYRQTSIASKALLEADPYNRLLARGPRVRLSAETLRDQALAITGLYSTKMYGPGVMPFQPEGLWQSPWNGENWVNAVGDDAHRRAIYTYWKRTTPYPSMLTFDSPTREFCQSRRIRTNTPLQALVLLNDPVYMEAASALASKMKAKNTDLKMQISAGYQLVTMRKINQSKLSILVNLYQESLIDYKKSKSKNPEESALKMVANTILNLDETITKE